jgi:tRNA (uracil-5-)-methyltransferase TRM9
MRDETIERLNAMNTVFYAQTAPHFDATRQGPWAGWAQIRPYVPVGRPLRVLDLGCGNGRFGVWLRGQVVGALHYQGTDNNQTLLNYARSALEGVEQVTLTAADLLRDPLPQGPFDLVVVFGVVHHVPSLARREHLLRDLATRVAPGGLLVFAAWRFYDNERLRRRVLPWPDDLERERGDYLLDWRRGTVAWRYCHHVDDAEHERLVAATGLDEVVRYRADGGDGRTNQYSLLRARAIASETS